ncbi:solute carrier family 22 member 7-like [Dermacentor variabilis]|uniref:solute carrier family 22 member 7-like n=1 Tax=Dermacentor variabilis TaxID=34621 RepID=UPI003F5C428A
MPAQDTERSARDDPEAPETCAATHPASSARAFVLFNDARTAIQESIYAILGHGNFQRRLLFTGMLSVVVLLLHAFAHFLIGRDVDHWCRPPNELSAMSIEAWRNVAIPLEADGSFSQCTVYDPPLPTGRQRQHREPVEPSNKRWLHKFTNIANMLGAALLVPAAGFVSDRIGRQLAIMGSVLCLLAFSVACSLAQTFVMFLVTRFCISASSCSVQVLMFILIYEVTGNQNRATYGVLDTAVGTTLVPPALHVLSLLEPQWLTAHLLLLVPTFMLVLWCCLLDESPSWLLCTGQPHAAEMAIVAAATSNGLSANKARNSFRALTSQIQKRETANLYSTTIMSTDTFLHEPVFRWGVLSVLLSWFSVNLAYYGLVLLNATTGHFWHTVHMVVQASLYASVCWYIRNHGQRETLSILLVLLCASAIAHAAASVAMASPLSSAIGIVVESLASAALSVNYGYTAEVFPTTIRSLGLTTSYAFGRMGVIMASVIVVLCGGPSEAGMPLNVAVAFLALLSGVFIQWLPEIFAQKRKEHRHRSERERKEAILTSLSSTIKPTKRSKKTRRKSSVSLGSTSSKFHTSVNRQFEPRRGSASPTRLGLSSAARTEQAQASFVRVRGSMPAMETVVKGEDISREEANRPGSTTAMGRNKKAKPGPTVPDRGNEERAETKGGRRTASAPSAVKSLVTA